MSVLCAVLLAAYLATVLVPFTLDFFALAVPDFAVIGPSLAGAVLAICGLVAIDDRFVPERAGGS